MDKQTIWKSVLWKRLSRPLVWTAVCFFLGVVLPGIFKNITFYYRSSLDESMGWFLGSICGVARLALILYCPISLFRAYKAAKLDVGSRTLIAEITEVRESHITVNDVRSRTIYCKAEGREFSAKTSTEYGNEIIGWKVPVRVSSYDWGVYEVLLDRMSKDYDPDLSGISAYTPPEELMRDGIAPWNSSDMENPDEADAWNYDWNSDGEERENKRLR